MEFAREDEGVRWFTLLESFGKTPAEWGEMELYQQKFLESAHDEKIRRQEEESEQ